MSAAKEAGTMGSRSNWSKSLAGALRCAGAHRRPRPEKITEKRLLKDTPAIAGHDLQGAAPRHQEVGEGGAEAGERRKPRNVAPREAARGAAESTQREGRNRHETLNKLKRHATPGTARSASAAARDPASARPPGAAARARSPAPATCASRLRGRPEPAAAPPAQVRLHQLPTKHRGRESRRPRAFDGGRHGRRGGAARGRPGQGPGDGVKILGDGKLKKLTVNAHQVLGDGQGGDREGGRPVDLSSADDAQSLRPPPRRTRARAASKA